MILVSRYIISMRRLAQGSLIRFVSYHKTIEVYETSRCRRWLCVNFCRVQLLQKNAVKDADSELFIYSRPP